MNGIFRLLAIIGGCWAANAVTAPATEFQTDKSVSKPSDLVVAIRATMLNHPMLKGKHSEVNVQEYAVSTAKAARYPSLSLAVDNVDDDYDRATLRLDQPLWAFGKIDNAIDIAESRVDTEHWRLLDIQRQLLEDTATSYAKIEGIKQRAEVAQHNIEAHTGYYERIERRHKGALSSEVDVRLAHARLLQAQTELQSIEGELAVAQADLLALTQVQVSTEENVSPVLTNLPSVDHIERLAITKGADIGLKKQLLQIISLEVKSEKLAVLPTLSFRMEKDILDHPNNDGLRVGLSLEARLDGMGFSAMGRVNGAKAQLSAAQYDLDNTIVEMRRRVSSLMLTRQVQKQLINVQKPTVEAMQETLASFLRQYETGRKSWLEVLNTQRELNTLQSQLVQSENDWLVLSLRVAALSGGLDHLAGLNQDE